MLLLASLERRAKGRRLRPTRRDSLDVRNIALLSSQLVF